MTPAGLGDSGVQDPQRGMHFGELSGRLLVGSYTCILKIPRTQWGELFEENDGETGG